MDIDLISNFEDSSNQIKADLKKLNESDDVTFSDKINYLISSQVCLLPVLLKGLDPSLVADSENDNLVYKNQADYLMKFNSLITSIQNSLYKKRESELKEEVDLNHPKFQKSLEWVIESVTETMKEVGIDQNSISTFVHKFSINMVGFEDNANKKLKGLSFNQIDEIKNPLIKKFKERNNEIVQ